jgi:hypothetical protein
VRFRPVYTSPEARSFNGPEARRFTLPKTGPYELIEFALAVFGGLLFLAPVGF